MDLGPAPRRSLEIGSVVCLITEEGPWMCVRDVAVETNERVTVSCGWFDQAPDYGGWSFHTEMFPIECLRLK